MEWWKLFSGTFVLIFLAELGDKTQLAAMAKTADSPDNSMAKWVVFLGASLALVASTFIAVFLGHILKEIVPDERYIKIAAAVLFLIFGVTILYETVSSYRKDAVVMVPAGGVAAAGERSFAGGLALRAAVDFEALAAKRYRQAAEKVSPELAEALLELAAEEEEHLACLHGLDPDERADAVWSCALPRAAKLSHRSFQNQDDTALLQGLIQSEEATAAFYRELASRTLIPSVRAVLTRLATEESNHAGRLRSLGEKV